MITQDKVALWSRFVKDQFASKPRLGSMLGNSQIVEAEIGCEVLIPVTSQGQEEWLNDHIVELMQPLRMNNSEFASLLPVSFSFLRDDGTVVKAEERTPRSNSQNAAIVNSEVEAWVNRIRVEKDQMMGSSRGPNLKTKKPLLSEKIHNFADSVFSIKSGGKRYTSPLLGWIALPIHLVGSIVSIFEKK